MPRFRPQMPLKDISALAARYSYQSDGDCIAAGKRARAAGHYDRDDFLLVCEWKTSRSRKLVAKNTARSIAEASGRALATDDERQRMELLCALHGVGVPTASALLFFAFPDRYPILDERALESLGAKPRTQYSTSFWLG